MELLLIVFAMLSAVTGAFTGVRGPDARIAPAQAAVGAQLAVSIVEEQAAPAVQARPADAPLSNEVSPPPGFALAAAVPLYADRLIE